MGFLSPAAECNTNGYISTTGFEWETYTVNLVVGPQNLQTVNIQSVGAMAAEWGLEVTSQVRDDRGSYEDGDGRVG